MTTELNPSLTAIVRGWPVAHRIAWAGVAATVGFFLYATVIYWLDGIGSADRLLILAGSAWAWNRTRPTLATLPNRPLSLIGLPLLAIGVAAVAPSWFALAQIGPRNVLVWLLYGSALAAVVGMTLLHFGGRTLTAIGFSLAFAAFALPLPGRINVLLQSYLQEWTTAVAEKSLMLWGFDVVRQGYVLRLPHGDLGVVEACSGIKAFTTYTAVAAFVAYNCCFGRLRGWSGGLAAIAAVLLAVPLVVFANGMRVFEMGLISEYAGQEATKGWRHEVLGSIPILLGLGVVILVAWAVAKGVKSLALRKTSPLSESDRDLSPVPSLPPNLFAGRIAAILAIVGIAVGIYGLLQPSVARTAIPDGNAPIDRIPMALGEWQGQELPIDPDILNELAVNKAIFRRYSNNLGYESYIWVLYWSTAKSVKGYHHPDICMPNRGVDLLEKDELTVQTKGGRTVPVTYREFGVGKEKQLVAYWTQEGRSFWTPEDEKAAFHMSFPFKWISKRMGERPADAADDRLVVLISTRSWGKGAGPRQVLLGVAGDVADQLYTVCPWADPAKGP